MISLTIYQPELEVKMTSAMDQSERKYQKQVQKSISTSSATHYSSRTSARHYVNPIQNYGIKMPIRREQINKAKRKVQKRNLASEPTYPTR